MLDWTKLDPEFMAFAEDMQKRYDGKGGFLDDEALAEREAAAKAEAEAQASREANEQMCTDVYLRAELIVSSGDPRQPDGGMPVRFELKGDDGSSWAQGWLPSCVVTESEGFDEAELEIIRNYFRSNAPAIFDNYFKRLTSGNAVAE